MHIHIHIQMDFVNFVNLFVTYMLMAYFGTLGSSHHLCMPQITETVGKSSKGLSCLCAFGMEHKAFPL